MRLESTPMACWYQLPPLMRYAMVLDGYSDQWKELKPEDRVGHLRHLWRKGDRSNEPSD